jgi:hypothetical protein
MFCGDFNAQETANTMWAFAKLERTDAALMQGLPRRAREILGEFNAQSLMNAVWAFAKLELRDEALLMGAATRRARDMLRDSNAQELANAVWAFAKLERTDAALMQGLPRRAREILREFNAEDMAQAMWGLAKVSQSRIALELLAGLCLEESKSDEETMRGPIAACERLQLLPCGLLWLVNVCRAPSLLSSVGGAGDVAGVQRAGHGERGVGVGQAGGLKSELGSRGLPACRHKLLERPGFAAQCNLKKCTFESSPQDANP